MKCTVVVCRSSIYLLLFQLQIVLPPLYTKMSLTVWHVFHTAQDSKSSMGMVAIWHIEDD